VNAIKEKKTGNRQQNARLLPGLKVGDGFTRHPFDIEFGVRTSGLIAGRHLLSGHRHDAHNTAYYGVAPSVFRTMVLRWRQTKPAAAIDEFTFIDLGAGMGRAVLLASEYPFREAVGVELHPTLARIAQRNSAVWRATQRVLAPIRIVCGDAVEFKFPDGPCIAFLFNPFGGPVLRRLLSELAKRFADRLGKLDILYVNNEHESVLKGQAGFQQVFQGEVKRSRADAIADHKILANQPDGEYATTNWEDCSIWRWIGE
jgi:SAM-dependent methyltransferase